ncbi:PREDICTED: uncharacterized protein LOC109342300 [Lupinus angustifolius]|uniref:uncharacterized protein LOC109342300 n=1 Tax=Lupinus angustifolius TaxID=3871 RepID=UPI00092F7D77|nr:PREDICTED: uncharacterized protein LOC109342300 [Lupinus angustifolius]
MAKVIRFRIANSSCITDGYIDLSWIPLLVIRWETMLKVACLYCMLVLATICADFDSIGSAKIETSYVTFAPALCGSSSCNGGCWSSTGSKGGGRGQFSGGPGSTISPPWQQHGQSGNRPPQWQQQQPVPWGWYNPHWPIPPCPFPTQGWARPNTPPHRQAGILGPRPPQQAYVHHAVSPASLEQSNLYAPTDIETAMHTMSLQQPDPSWYMDTGATSHMTSSIGLSDGDVNNEM